MYKHIIVQIYLIHLLTFRPLDYRRQGKQLPRPRDAHDFTKKNQSLYYSLLDDKFGTAFVINTFLR